MFNNAILFFRRRKKYELMLPGMMGMVMVGFWALSWIKEAKKTSPEPPEIEPFHLVIWLVLLAVSVVTLGITTEMEG